jgi:hypothetical protein
VKSTGAAQLAEVTAGSCGEPHPASNAAAAHMLQAKQLVAKVLISFASLKLVDRLPKSFDGE